MSMSGMCDEKALSSPNLRFASARRVLTFASDHVHSVLIGVGMKLLYLILLGVSPCFEVFESHNAMPD